MGSDRVRSAAVEKEGGKKAFYDGSNSFVATVKMMQITCE